MASNKGMAEVPARDKKKTTCNISFASVKEMQDAAGDLELKESVTFTVTGNITSLNMHNTSDWQDASIGLDVTSIKGITKAKETNDKELADMTEEKE